MKKEDFLLLLTEELMLKNPIQLETNFKDLDEWDSLNKMVLISVVSDHFEVTITEKELEKIASVNSLVDLIGENKFS